MKEYTEVKSSTIIKLGYERSKQELEVHFKNGHIYLFQQVPSNFYIDCLLSESVGKYFFNNIKDSFPYTILK